MGDKILPYRPPARLIRANILTETLNLLVSASFLLLGDSSRIKILYMGNGDTGILKGDVSLPVILETFFVLPGVSYTSRKGCFFHQCCWQLLEN